MKEYQMLMGKDSMNLFNAVLQQQYNPSEENKKRVDDLSAELSKTLEWAQKNAELSFIAEHGQELLDFVKAISKKNFLVGQTKPYSLSWEIKWDSDSDDYWVIRFWKGKFDYVKEICGGYAGAETLEENLSSERVMELLATKPEQPE